MAWLLDGHMWMGGNTSHCKPPAHTSTTPTNQVVSERISYQPHYRTLTDGGKAHFSEIAYAVADLVDNSIQARVYKQLVCVRSCVCSCGRAVCL